MKLFCKSYWVYTVKDFIGYLFSLYYCCLTCLRLAEPKVQLKMSWCNTEWAIPEKFSSFLLYPWKFIILKPTPSPCLFFSIIVFLYCNFWLQPSILLIKAPLPIQSHKNTLLQLKIRIWMELFWNQKFLFFHKRNFNPKVIN